MPGALPSEEDAQPRITACTLSPSAIACSSFFKTNMPLAPLSYAVTLCLCEKTGVLEKAMYMPIEQSVHVAPAIIVRQWPYSSSSMATLTETSDEAHAASTTAFMPSRLKTFVHRPAVTLPRKPGKESSRHSGKCALNLVTACSTSFSGRPILRSTFSTTT